MDGMDDMDMTMQMTYVWSNNVTVLFDWWNTNGDSLYYALTLIALFTFAFLSEAWSALSIKIRHSLIHNKDDQRSKMQQIMGSTPENIYYLKGSFFYLIKLILGYQLMLAVMTYNVGISIAIFSGAFVGNFLFVRFAGVNSKGEEVDSIACHL